MSQQIQGVSPPAMSIMAPVDAPQAGAFSAILEAFWGEINQLRGELNYTFAVLRELTPEKRFNEACERVRKQAEEEARQAVATTADPRVDSLVQQVNAITDTLPNLIASAIKEAMSQNPPAEPPQNDDMDFGEEPEKANVTRRRK